MKKFMYFIIFCGLWTPKAQAEQLMVNITPAGTVIEISDVQKAQWVAEYLLDAPVEVKNEIMMPLINGKLVLLSEPSKIFIQTHLDGLSKFLWLTELNLSGLNLTAFPEWIFQFKGLTSLNLSYNKIVLIPANIGLLVNLMLLDLSFNQITSIPDEIALLTLLTEFNIANNALKMAPKSMGKLKKLKKLSLNNNYLTILPDELSECTELQYLYLNDNQLQYIPQSFEIFVNIPIIIEVDDNPWVQVSGGMGFGLDLLSQKFGEKLKWKKEKQEQQQQQQQQQGKQDQGGKAGNKLELPKIPQLPGVGKLPDFPDKNAGKKAEKNKMPQNSKLLPNVRKKPNLKLKKQKETYEPSEYKEKINEPILGQVSKPKPMTKDSEEIIRNINPKVIQKLIDQKAAENQKANQDKPKFNSGITIRNVKPEGHITPKIMNVPTVKPERQIQQPPQNHVENAATLFGNVAGAFMGGRHKNNEMPRMEMPHVTIAPKVEMAPPSNPAPTPQMNRGKMIQRENRGARDMMMPFKP